MTRTFIAPGRVNLIGEHTDYAGGLVLPAAIDLAVRIQGGVAERIRLTSEQFPAVVDLDPRGGEGEGWGRFAAAVASELDALGRPPVGFAGRVTSTLPVGAGLSSSAALEVAIGTALCAVADFAIEPLALAQVAQRAEHRAVGVPCGIMDQAASVLGEEGHAILLDTGTLGHRAVPLPPDLTLVIVDSGVRHVLADSGYADRRRELEQALTADGELEPQLARRLRHLRTENERVREVVACLDRGDAAGLGALFRAGHESLRDDFEVSTPELDRLVDCAYEAGAVAARMTGGGFGGSIVALVESNRDEAFATRVAQAVPGARGFVTRAAAGAREL